MNIRIVWGCAEGETALSSFDRALSEANIHNMNLVPVSSILPPRSVVTVDGVLPADEVTIGARRFVVMARATSKTPGEQITVGLGWAASENGGVIMEGYGGTEQECRETIEAGLKDCLDLRGWEEDTDVKLASHTVKETGTAHVTSVFPQGFENVR